MHWAHNGAFQTAGGHFRETVEDVGLRIVDVQTEFNGTSDDIAAEREIEWVVNGYMGRARAC